MKTYRVPVTYSFRVDYDILASSAQEAKRTALNHCGLTLGRIHSTLSYGVDWHAYANPHDKKVGVITVLSE